MIPTVAGHATHGETYVALMHHITECQELAAIKAHLHNTEGSAKDVVLARAWLQVSEHFKIMKHKLTQLAMGKMQ